MNNYMQKKEAIFNEMEKIEHTIDTLKNIQERLVLKYAYIHLMQYDEIAKKNGFFRA